MLAMTRVNLTYIFLCIGMVLARRERGLVPTIINDPDHLTVERGETVILPCTVENLGTKYVVWRKSTSDNPLTISRFIYTPDERLALPDINNWNLRIERVTTSDSGVYRCQVSSATKLFTGSVTLLVTPRKGLGPLYHTIINDPDHLTIEEGETVVLPCKVENLGYRTVIWRNGQSGFPITVSRRIITQDKRVTFYNSLNWDLRIDHVTTSDSGVYQCHATSYNEIFTGSVRLEVKPRKEITSLPTSLPTTLIEATPLPGGQSQSQGPSPSSKVTNERLRSAQLEYYLDEILTNKKRRQMMVAEHNFYKAMTKFLREKKEE